MFRVASLILLIALVLPAAVAHSDSIVIDGTLYEGVYVGTGGAMYYVQDPSDGSMISVPKPEVKASDVSITRNRHERRKLYDSWKAKRTESGDRVPLTVTYDEWRSRLSETLPPTELRQATMEAKKQPTSKNGIEVQSKDGVAHFTNKPQSRASRLGGRKMYMGSDGVAIMTNTPEEFRGKNGYVEVVLHYEPIEVPERFRIKPKGKDVAPETNSVDDIIEFYAGRYRLDKELVYAVVKAESNGNPYAVSSAGARGLMQLMPGTAREMGVTDIFDPAQNIAGGTQYLSKLLKLFDNNQTMALAGYNAGPGNVRKYGGVPPFAETQHYIRSVQQHVRQYKRRGVPTFQVADARPVVKSYLPPESKQYYQIVLDNGLTVAAEKVYFEDMRYIYSFKGRTGHFPEDQVLAVYEPS